MHGASRPTPFYTTYKLAKRTPNHDRLQGLSFMFRIASSHLLLLGLYHFLFNLPLSVFYFVKNESAKCSLRRLELFLFK